MTFGAESDENSSHAMLDRYVEAGGNLIDTADVYSQGVSEEITSSWLRRSGHRNDVLIATKARFQMDNVGSGASRDYLRLAVEASLSRLGVDVIDLYQMHSWDPATPLEETLGALNEFVDSGKIRAIGVSNYTGWQLERSVMMARAKSWAPVVSLQPQYSLLSREIEHELLPVCIEEDLSVLPWSPLGGGWLSGKYSAAHRPSGETRLGEDPNRGVEAYDRRNTDRTWEILAVVEAIATTHDVPMSQVALNWVRSRPAVTSVLLGCRNVTQLNDNLGALSWDLNDEETANLSQASAPGIPIYPHGFMESYAGFDMWANLGTRTEAPLIG
jgi:aryl-alcohol dehydrogenase (NADP+)